MSTAYQEYMKTERWGELSYACKCRDGWACRLCGARRNLQAHHRWYPRELGTETVDALTTLCDACHKRHHRQDDYSGFLWFVLGAVAAYVMESFFRQ